MFLFRGKAGFSLAVEVGSLRHVEIGLFVNCPGRFERTLGSLLLRKCFTFFYPCDSSWRSAHERFTVETTSVRVLSVPDAEVFHD